MATMSIPDRSLAQRHSALERANMIRIGRAALKADVKALSSREGRAMVAGLLRAPPSLIHSMKVEDLLLAIRGFGDPKVRKLLWAFGVSPRKRVGGLSVRQRGELADMLRSYSARDLEGGR